MQTFAITYQMPGHPVVTDKGMTEHGARLLMDAILRGGGWGYRMTVEQAQAAERKAVLEDRAARAAAHNRRVIRASHDAYCNQMPRARGFRT